MRRISIILILIAILGGCSSTPKSETRSEKVIIERDTLIKVQPPKVQGFGYGQTLIVPNPSGTAPDTVVQYIRVKPKRDTVVEIRYYPRYNLFSWDIQPDEMAVTAKNRETTQTTETKVIEKKTNWSLIWIALLVIVVSFLIYFYRRNG